MKTFEAQIVGAAIFSCRANSLEEANKVYESWMAYFDKGDFEFGTVEFDELEEC